MDQQLALKGLAWATVWQQIAYKLILYTVVMLEQPLLTRER